MPLRILVFAATMVVCATMSSATLHVDDFQTGATTLGWNGGGGASRVASGGPAGAGDAYINVRSANNLAVHNETTDWKGDLTAIGATTINTDLMVPTGSPPLQMRIVLFGHAALSNRWTSKTAQAVPADGVWRSYAFSLAESDLRNVSLPEGGPTTYAQMMANTLQVMLRHNAGAPSSGGTAVFNGRLNVDNIRLAGATTPPAGDFDGDGDVDGVDLTHPTLGWKARYGADLEGADFLRWQRDVGLPASGAATEAVPEPSAWVMLIVLVTGIAARSVAASRRD